MTSGYRVGASSKRARIAMEEKVRILPDCCGFLCLNKSDKESRGSAIRFFNRDCIVGHSSQLMFSIADFFWNIFPESMY